MLIKKPFIIMSFCLLFVSSLFLNAGTKDQDRSPEKVGIFTRNPEKLIASHSGRRLNEARYFTPRLGRLYFEQRPKTAGQSPYKSARRNTKRREHKLSQGEAAVIHKTSVPFEGWDAIVDTPQGYTVHQRDTIIDPFQVDDHGRLNIQRMLNGEPPIGPGGSAIELHHALRQDPGPLLEVTGDLHRRESGPEHGIEQTHPIDRPAFDRFRRAYWIARAYDMLQSDPRFVN